MNMHVSQSDWRAHRPMFEAKGIVLPDVIGYATDPDPKRMAFDFRSDYMLAMDAQSLPVTTSNSAIPAMLSSYIDPEVLRAAYSPTMAAEIAGERKAGDWTRETIFFPMIDYGGEVTSYDDYSEAGTTSVNANWPQRQSYRYQLMVRYGELELERAGLAKLNWVSELELAATQVMNRFMNFAYFFGVQGLQNEGLVNSPRLPASIAPGTKAAGNGNVWLVGGYPNATALEIYADIQSMFQQMYTQSDGVITAKDSFVLAYAPAVSSAFNTANSFGLNVRKVLKDNFDNIRFEQATQYTASSNQNPQGIAGGNMVQLICEKVEGQDSVYCAFTEKLRAHALIRATSSFKKKVSGGTWGTIWRRPFACVTLVGA